MRPDKKYIVQVTGKDMREIADAANAHGGEGVIVDRTQDGLEISIDKVQLTRWIRIVIAGGVLQ